VASVLASLSWVTISGDSQLLELEHSDYLWRGQSRKELRPLARSQ
jgi:hypothetical protein